MTLFSLLVIGFVLILSVVIFVLIDRQFNFNKIRLVKDAAIRPLVKFLSFLGLSPMFFSVVSLTFGVFAAVAYGFSFEHFLVFIILGAFCDTLDGSVARFTHVDSVAGRFTDYFFDRIVMICVSIAVFLSIKDPAWYYVALPIFKLVPNAIYLLNRNEFKAFPLIPSMYLYYLILVFDPKIATIATLIILFLNTVNVIYSSFKLSKAVS